MKIKKKAIAIILTVLLTFSLCGCDLFGILYPDYDISIFEQAFGGNYDYRADIVPFSEMEYARPDVALLQATADEISDMVSGSAGRNEITSKLNDFYTLYYNFKTMETIAGIRSDMDVTDEYYFEEYSYCTSMDATVSRMLDDMLCDCANSDMCTYLDAEYFGGMLGEKYSVDGTFSYTDELVSLFNKENSLLSDYRALYMKMISYDGDMYEEYNEEACNIYIELVKVRKAIAEELDYQCYEDYMAYSYSRDYTPEDLEEYLAAVKEYIVPIYNKVYDKGLMNGFYELDDLSNDAAIQHFDSFVSKLPAQITEARDFMKTYGLYNISGDDKVNDNSYNTYLDNYDSPFMFIKTGGSIDDLLTMAHEFGHFCDDYVNYNGDFCLDTTETMSQGLEYMLLCYLDDEGTANALTKFKMLDTLYLYINQASFYDFEHRVFDLPDEELTVENINSIFGDVAEEYGYYNDSTTKLTWIDITHFFEYPFYVISYCLSDSAAFSLYNMELEQTGTGLDMYIRLLNDTANFSFAELLEKEGMSSPVSAQTVQEIAGVLAERLGV